MNINPKIFKSYDIRGIYPEDLNEKVAYNIGRSFVVLTKAKNIVVARDMRLSSPSLAKSLIEGITSQGADVIDIGMTSTDQFYFVMGEYKYDGGFIVTASHNPKEYNGFKILGRNNIFVCEDSGMEELRDLAITEKFKDVSKPGKVIKKNFEEPFIQKLLSFVDFKKVKPFKIVIDASSGMAGPVLGKIFKDSPCQITPLYFEPDGSFPGHEPNPMDDENREDLKAKVLGTKADFGFIFDGDADRFIMIDQGGEFIPPDYIVAILAEDILKKNPGAKVVSDATVSWAIKDTVLKHRGELIVWKTGHSLITQKMKETGAIFAGETSGHFYFREFYDFDTGILPALLLLQIISQKKEPFARIIEDFKRKYFLTGIINFKIEDKEGVMRKVEEIYKAKEAKISHIDGVSIEFLDWRFILRPSNTEPLLRLILEARSADLRDQKREEVSKLVQEG